MESQRRQKREDRQEFHWYVSKYFVFLLLSPYFRRIPTCSIDDEEAWNLDLLPTFPVYFGSSLRFKSFSSVCLQGIGHFN